MYKLLGVSGGSVVECSVTDSGFQVGFVFVGELLPFFAELFQRVSLTMEEFLDFRDAGVLVHDWVPYLSVVSLLGSSVTVDRNTAWGLRATSYLVTQGISPVTAQRAINAYLNGDAMTAGQSDLVDKAIIGIGQPPSAVELNPTVPSAVPYSSYRRDAKGQIFGIKSTGSEVAISDTQYLSLGMPALTTDLYSWRYTKLGKAVPASSITSKFKITTERLMVLNRWKSLPELKKGMRVKVPA